MDSALDGLPHWARDLLDAARVAHLGTIDAGGRPRVLPVTFVVHDGALCTAVDRKPKRVPPERLARVAQLRRRPDAAITVDRYSDDWSELAWVQALGRIEVVGIEAAPEALAALVSKYPQYREEPPPGPLLRLRPERVLSWRSRDAEAGSG